MLTIPPMFGTSRGILDLYSYSLVGICRISSPPQWQGTPFSAPMTEAQLSACMAKSQILNCMVGPQLLNIMFVHQLLNTMAVPPLNLFSKSSKFQPITSHPLSSPISCRGFILIMVIVISLARGLKLHQLTTHLNS